MRQIWFRWGRRRMPAKARHGTRLNGVPSATQMRAARRQKLFMSVTDVTVDPDIGACRATLHNIAAARKLVPHRGTPMRVETMLAALDALERARVPLRSWYDPDRGYSSAAVHIVSEDLNIGDATARSLLRRLTDLRSRLT
jgi:hypothetical protein